jgi:sodium-dependent phosphate cotransporter
MGQMGDGDQLERAFAGATVHDMFNFMSVAILLPVEVVTGYLEALTGALVKNASTEKGDSWEGPVKKLVSPLGKRVINANKDLTKKVALGDATCDNGGGFYPIVCEDPNNPTYNTCSSVGLIACDKKHDRCPAFFNAEASPKDDKVSGGVIFFISIIILFTCLLGLVTILQKMLLGVSTRIVYKATNVNGYLAMAIGAGITIIVQSSSITTSALTPLVGMGALRLEQMYPLTLGANIGTTMTAIMSALVTTGTKSLQVALAHLFFNLSGVVIFYPIPYMRNLPLHAARRLGKATRVWRGFPLLYIAVMFILVPMMFLGLSFLYSDGHKSYTVLAVFITLFLGFGALYTAYWCKFQDGQTKCAECFQKRERKRVVMQELPDDMEYLKAKLAALIEHTGLPSDEDAKEGDEEAEVEA